MTRDISDRKQTELALQSSEERFRRAILDAPLPIMLHGEDGEVVQINQTWTELTGYTHSDIPTIADWTEKAYGSRKEVVQADIERLYNLDRRISEGEYTVTTRNGEAQIWEFYSAPLGRLSDGRRLVISTAIDITKRKQAEAEIRQLNETLEQRVAERTAQLEEANQQLEAFAYSIAHDLRAPLRGMQGLAEALLEDYSKCLDALGQEYTHHLVSSAQRLDNLINDLLTYSRLSRAELRLSIVDLNLVMSEAMTQVEAELKQQQATVTLLSVLPKVRGHRTTLVQVVTNLLTNAIKFVENTQPQVQIWAETQDEWVQLWVADNGIGILPEHQQRIFRVFERLHGIETYSGTGIGLAIVQKGVERMGGQVGVESELGKGSRFWFKLRSEHC
jgi:PAS domain S-box-containing protein